MASALLGLATLIVAAIAARASVRTAFTILFASIVLVPAGLGFPTSGVVPVLTIHRVVLLGVLFGLVWRQRGRRLWRVTPTTVVFLLYLAIVLVTGIMLAPTALDLGPQLTAYLVIVEQAVVLVVCIALARAEPDPTWFLKPIAAVLLVSATIAAIEHATGDSWSHWLFQAVPSQQGDPGAAELARRAGTVRVRAGNEFPLGYAWVSAALLPALLVVALRWRRLGVALIFGGSALVVTTIYWSFARSAILALIVAVVVLGALARDRRVASLTLAAAALALAAFAVVPELSHHFSSSIDQGSIDVRQQRIPIVLGAVSQHPWTGLGLSGLQSVGLQGVDATYLLSYGVTGPGGVAGLLGLLVVAFLGVARGVTAEVRRLRLAAAALAAGVLTLVAAGIAFDSMALNSTADVLWVLAGVGIVVAERSRGPVTLWAAPSLLPPVFAFGALVGVALVMTAPTSYARQVQFSTLPIQLEAAPYDPDVPGDTLVNTVCGVAQAEAAARPHVSVSCRDLYTAPGLGALRVEADSASEVRAAEQAIAAGARRAGVTALAAVVETPLTKGVPTAVTTSPLWIPVVVVMLLFALSGSALRAARGRARRRRRR